MRYSNVESFGIHVSSRTNIVCTLDFEGNKLLNLSADNNLPGADIIAKSIITCANNNKLLHVVVALESTSFYNLHITNSLSSHEELLFFSIMVYCLNPKSISNYRKSFIDIDKTDPLDAFIIADFARVGRIQSKLWRGSQHLALQRLSRHRLHLIEAMTREKTYIVSNIYLKFSELAVLDKNERSFYNTFGITSAAMLMEYMSLEEITYASLEELVEFISLKGKNRFSDSLATAKVLKKAAQD